MNHSTPSIPFWRDERVLKWAAQIVFLFAVIAFFAYLFNNMITGLQRQGTTLGFTFLSGIASFDIGETLIPYDRTSSYLRAFQVGLYNTLQVSIWGIFFSTVLGFILGIARLSTNWLVNRLAALYLEIFRNLSLLVFLVFWYLGIFLKFPKVKDAIMLPGDILLSNRGIAFPKPLGTETTFIYGMILLVGLILAFALPRLLSRRFDSVSGFRAIGLGFIFFALTLVAGWVALPVSPVAWDMPFVKGLNFGGGKVYSPELMALTSGLILYTAAFIGETVRAGILAVSKGQLEASHALGLDNWQTLRLIIIPQAMRVIIPPLTSQYLNVTKNSSLAIAIGFADVFYVSNTIINQSGRAVEVISMVMAIYLTLSLLTSWFMNWYNAKTQLVER